MSYDYDKEILDYIDYHVASTGETKSDGRLDFTDFVSYIVGGVEKIDSRPLDSPAVVQWEVTSKCNLDCDYCYFYAIPGNADLRDLTTEEALYFVQQMAECNVLAVQVEGGEPFVRKDLVSLIRAIKRHRIAVYIATNGSLIDREKAGLLADVLDRRTDHVQVSLDGPTAEVHDPLGGKASFQKVYESLVWLSEAGVRVMVGMVVTESNLDSIVATYELVSTINGVEKFNVSPALAVANYPGFPAASKHTLLPAFNELHRIRRQTGGPVIDARLGHAFHLPTYRRRMAELYKGEPETPFDRAGRSIVAVGPNGDVYPDHHMMFPETSMGNVLEQRLGAIWKNPKWGLIRNGRSAAAECRRCDMRLMCGQRSIPLGYSRWRTVEAKDPNCVYSSRDGEPVNGPIGALRTTREESVRV